MNSPEAYSVPESVHDALADYMNGLSDEHRQDVYAQGRLWLEASWKQAQAMNISERQYARWVRTGLWNIAGDPNAARAIETFRALGGNRGHLIALAGLTPEAAVEQAKTNGIVALIEGCQAVVGLMNLGSDLLDEEQPEAAQPPKPSERIDFS